MNYKEGLLPIIAHHQDTFIKNGWMPFFDAIQKKPYFDVLNQRIMADSEKFNLFPSADNVFNAFLLLNIKDLKCVIIGQDPYQVASAAHGLAFSHPDDYPYMQPSLKNIYKELENNGYQVNRMSGNLTPWVHQGVFLINTALTVRESQSNSHGLLWKPIIVKLFKFLAKTVDKMVVIMWGKQAQSYSDLFESYYLLKSGHPSPYSAHLFFNHHHFQYANEKLIEWQMTPIDWSLTSQH